MRLILRDYLGGLKESAELDLVLGNLLFSMGFRRLSRPQIGSRQFGVDLAAIGADPDDSIRKLFLFTIKRGDLDRSEWDGNPTAVRSSLNEIFDVYIPTHVPKEFRALPKKIVLCLGGELKQAVALNWGSFANEHIKQDVEIGLWDGDKLTLLIEQFFLSEHLLPLRLQARLRKSLALIGDNDYDLHHFYSCLDEILFEADSETPRKMGNLKEKLKALRIVNMCLLVLFHWAKLENNLRQAVLAAERVVLRCWDWMRVGNLLANRRIVREFESLYNSYLVIGEAFFLKMRHHCLVKNGLFVVGHNQIEYPLRTFEIIGMLSTLGLNYRYLYYVSKSSDDLANAREITDILVHLIRNNPSACTPLLDGNSIEIAITLVLLFGMQEYACAGLWIGELIDRTAFAYKMGNHFPVSTDSYEDLIELEAKAAEKETRLMDISTIYPILMDWCAILDLQDSYSHLRIVSHSCREMNLQMWYPDATTDAYMYRKRIVQECGDMLHSISLPENLDAVLHRMERIRSSVGPPEALSCVKYGLFGLGPIACRHFRNPLPPFYWQSLVKSEGSKTLG